MESRKQKKENKNQKEKQKKDKKEKEKPKNYEVNCPENDIKVVTLYNSA